MTDWFRAFDRVSGRGLVLAAVALGSLMVGISYFIKPPIADPAIELAARLMIAIPLAIAAVAAWRISTVSFTVRRHKASFEARVNDATDAEWDVLCRVAQDGDEEASLPTDDPVVQGLVDDGLLIRLSGQSLYGDSATYGLSDDARTIVLARCRKPPAPMPTSVPPA